jgi:opacity protein-like surface antigen
MKSAVKTLVLAACLAAAATAADAQNRNPAGRGSNSSFFFDALPSGDRAQSISGPLGGNTTGRNVLGRPLPRFGAVTPVPEPSEWAMLVAGLALVGFIVRRGSRR